MLERYNVPASAIRLASPRGGFVMWPVTPSIILQVANGHGEAELVEAFERANRRLLAGKQGVVIFHDGMDLTGYDSAFRTEMVEFSKGVVASGQLKTMYMLTRSKLVAMGIAVVNLAVRSNFEVFSDRRIFERKLVGLGGGAALSRTGSERSG